MSGMDESNADKFFEMLREKAIHVMTTEDDLLKLEQIFKPHADTLRIIKVKEVAWYGCHRQSLGKPFWTWHEIWVMASGHLDEGDTRGDFKGLIDAIEGFCVYKDKSLQPPMDGMIACDFKFSI